MNPQTTSRTALATSLMRALHTRADPRPILDDPWGDRLMPAQALMLVYQMVRSRVPELPATPDPDTLRRTIDGALRANVAYANVLMRSRFTEDALGRAVTRGVRQYVLVGAGFDSYALRRPPEAADLSVIEIDPWPRSRTSATAWPPAVSSPRTRSTTSPPTWRPRTWPRCCGPPRCGPRSRPSSRGWA